MKTKLISSAPDAVELLKMIARFFYSVPGDFLIHEKVFSNGIIEGDVYKKASGQKLTEYVVKVKKGRYRFELILPEGK